MQEQDRRSLTRTLLTSDNIVERRSAAHILGQLGERQAIPALLTALTDPYDIVRAAAALGALGDEQVINALIEALADRSWVVRNAIITALRDFSSTQLLPSLMRALHHAQLTVRREATCFLGTLSNHHLVAALVSVLSDSHWSVRSTAAAALGSLGNPQAVPALILALADPDAAVRREAARALGTLGDPKAVEPLTLVVSDGDWVVARQALLALEQLRRKPPNSVFPDTGGDSQDAPANRPYSDSERASLAISASHLDITPTGIESNEVFSTTSSPSLRHLGIIMDGNGRWATQRGQPRLVGHVAGLTALHRLVNCAVDEQIEILSVYAFSTENWHRSGAEVPSMMGLFEDLLQLGVPQFHRDGVRLCIRGHLHNLSADIQCALRQAEELTKQNTRITLNFCFNPDPDLIIRTGGEMRVSNFLLWQAAYSEYYVTPTLWPDFGLEELQAALESYRQRHRRFGK